MAISTIITTIISILTLAAAHKNSPPNTSPATSFYDVLNSYSLPMGLFPKGINDFSIDSSSGRFELHLFSSSPCDTKFETRVRYEWNITGSVNYGKIANLSGVSAQELFLWLPVKNIQVDIPSSGLIYFDTGVVFKQFSLSFFETPKDCDAMGMAGDEGENDVFEIDDHLARIVENQSGKIVRNHITDDEQRAVS